MDKLIEIAGYFAQIRSWADFVAWFAWLPTGFKVAFLFGLIGTIAVILTFIIGAIRDNEV